MADSYITSGATIKCSCGDKTTKLTVYPDRTVFLTEKPMANISDHVSMYNIAPFGKCHITSFPPTGSATAANHGCLTPMPCVPGTISEWLQGKGDYIIKGRPALLKSSYCKCQWGGIITITDDGQTDTGDADLNRVALQSEEEMLKKQEEKKLAEKAALDSADFAPGVRTAAEVKLSNRAIKMQGTAQKKEKITEFEGRTYNNKTTKPSSVKIKASVAELVLLNFANYPPMTQERILEMANEMPDSLNIQERLKLSEHFLRIESSIRVPKGKRMTIDKADKQSANPKYRPDTPYSVNCATTAAAYVLRIHGFDVKAKGNRPNTKNEWLSQGNSFKIWKNVDGSEAKPVETKDWMRQKSTKERPVHEMTPAMYRQYIEENTKEEGLYILTLKWKEIKKRNPDGTISIKGGGGHATIIQRWKDKDGNLHLSQIEPQVYSEKVGAKRSVDILCQYLDPNPPEGKGIMRVDNKLIDTQYLSLFDL